MTAATLNAPLSSAGNEEIVDRLRSQLDRFKQDHAAAAKELAVLRRDFAKAKEDLEHTSIQLTNKSTEYTTLDVAFRSFGSIRTRLEEERDNARAAVLRAEREITSLKDAARASSSSSSSSTSGEGGGAAHDVSAAIIADLTKALKDAEMKINALQVDAELAVAEIEYEKVIGENLRAELKEKDDRIATLEDQLLRLSMAVPTGSPTAASFRNQPSSSSSSSAPERSAASPLLLSPRHEERSEGNNDNDNEGGESRDEDEQPPEEFGEDDWIFACGAGRLDEAVDKLGFSRLEVFPLDVAGWMEEEEEVGASASAAAARSVARALTGVSDATRDEARSALVTAFQPESQVLLAVLNVHPKHYATSEGFRAAAAAVIELVGEAYEASGGAARVAVLFEGARKWSLDNVRIVNI